MTFLGHGVGLRSKHYTHLLHNPVRGVDWFEIISENFFEPGGRPWSVLEKIRREVPVVAHGVSLGIGSVDPLSERYLARLASLVDRIEPIHVSDHLCWGRLQNKYAHDLLPLPYTEESLQLVVERVLQVQERLKRSILLENVSSYVTFTQSTIPEWEFLSALAKRSGCGILLDINNVFVSAQNHGFSPTQYIDAIPPEKVMQFHLAGHSQKEGYLSDSHIGPVPESVWELYRYAAGRFGEVPSLIEWDEDIPDFETLVAESQRARAFCHTGAKGSAKRFYKRSAVNTAQRPVRRQACLIDSGIHLKTEMDPAVATSWPTGVTGLPFSHTGMTSGKDGVELTQQRFWRLITAPSGVAKALLGESERDPIIGSVMNWINGPDESFARSRLDIYANMYFYRLLDALRADFPKVAALMGDDQFHNLVTDYLLEYPSTNPSLRYLGERLADFLKERGEQMLSELAMLEWARVSVFDQEDEASMTPEELKALAPESWEELTLRPIAALRILSLLGPACEQWSAIERSEEPPSTAAQPSEVLVWRVGHVVTHRQMSATEAAALRVLREGATFAEWCERIANPDEEISSAASRAFSLLHRWLRDGLIAR